MLKNQHFDERGIVCFLEHSDYFSKQCQSNNFCDEDSGSFLRSRGHFGHIIKNS